MILIHGKKPAEQQQQRKMKKINCTTTEIQSLGGEVEVRKRMLSIHVASPLMQCDACQIHFLFT